MFNNITLIIQLFGIMTLKKYHKRFFKREDTFLKQKISLYVLYDYLKTATYDILAKTCCSMNVMTIYYSTHILNYSKIGDYKVSSVS